MKVPHSCLTLCDLLDYTGHGVLQDRILEWAVFPFSRGSSQPRDETRVSCSSCLGVGSLSFLQGIVPTQGSNPGLPHCREIFYHLSHKGSPRILERVAYPFSSRYSWPRNQTGVSCIADGFLTNWAMREAHRVTWLMAKALRPDCLVQIHFPLACSVTIGSYWPSP